MTELRAEVERLTHELKDAQQQLATYPHNRLVAMQREKDELVAELGARDAVIAEYGHATTKLRDENERLRLAHDAALEMVKSQTALIEGLRAQLRPSHTPTCVCFLCLDAYGPVEHRGGID